MREILFKAKRIDNGEWVEGFIDMHTFVPLEESKEPYLGTVIKKVKIRPYDYESYEVDESTICQYTGLTDKNGQKIWENDVVAYWDTYSTENGYAEADCVGKVIWDDETLSFQVTGRLSAESYEVLDECSVIGNIFDNPELLSE